MTVVVVIIIVLIALVVVENVMAGTNTYVDSARSPAAVRQQVEGLFNQKLNRFGVAGSQLLITPKLRKDAPTLHVDITPNGSGSKIHMWATVMAEKRGFMPWVSKHGLYVWRKQRSMAAAIRSAG